MRSPKVSFEEWAAGMGDVVSVKDAAKLAGATERTVRRWLSDGRLSSTRVEVRGIKEVRIGTRELYELLEGAGETVAPAPMAALTELVARQHAIIEALRAELAEVKHEQRDARGQLGQLQETAYKIAGDVQDLRRALPAPKDVAAKWWHLKKRN